MMSEKEKDRIQLNFSVSKSKLFPGEADILYIMLQIKQPKMKLDNQRLPINTSFVIDRSGSMRGSKLDYTKQAVEFAISHLDFEDMASVVIFDNIVDVLVDHQKVNDKEQIFQLIKSIRERGRTNLSGGLLMGAEKVKDSMNDKMINRVILLTDGLANEGIYEPQKIVNLVKSISSQNISVSTLGVGDGFAEDLLVDMAECGNGNFYFIASPEEIPEIFKKELVGLLNVTGQNLRLNIIPGYDCRIIGVLGYPVTFDGDIVKVKLPDMYNGDTKTILIEAKVFPNFEGIFHVADLNFAYSEVIDDLSNVKYDISVSIEATYDFDNIESGVDLKVLKEVEIFKTAELKESAMKVADSGDFIGAQDLLNAQEMKLKDLYDKTGDDEVREELDKLIHDKRMMDRKTYDSKFRKGMKMNNYMNRKKR